MTILFLEDDDAIAGAVCDFLAGRGCRVARYTTLAAARQALAGALPDLALLDRNLPDGDGADLCRALRARCPRMPVLLLTVRGDTPDVLEGFGCGADDYVTKPFELEVLYSRLQALWRRSRPETGPLLRCGPITLDEARQAVSCRGQAVALGALEYQLLLLLLRNQGRTLTRREALEARDRFARDLADIAHQLKTPLTALSLAAQGADPALRSRMQPPLDQLERLGGALLLLARLDAGALPLHPEPADLFTLVQMAADGLQPLADRAGVRLDVPEAPPIPVTADPDWTVEALMNLMKNCIEHSPPGGAVHCTCADGALYAELCIRDEGAGFAPADLPRLFDRFYRGAGAAPGSTGIGLAIARELLQRQGAVLRAENHPEGGGVFRVRFYPGFPRP